jgi:hypothetical protein
VNHKLIFVGVYAFVTLLLTACAGPQVQHSGFLEDYSHLQEVEGSPGLSFEKVSSESLLSYDKMYVKEIRVITMSEDITPQKRALINMIQAYTTASYKKNISKFSENYTLVDVGQQKTIIMDIALSFVAVDDGRFTVVPMNDSSFQTYSDVRLLVEARATDAMSDQLLSRSMNVIEQKVSGFKHFSDVQKAIDSWLDHMLK